MAAPVHRRTGAEARLAARAIHSASTRRRGSHPRIAPGRPAIADKVRSYGGRSPRRMVLSEAIPIAMTAWVSQAQPILRKAPRRRQLLLRLQGSTGVGADFVRDWIHRPRRTPRRHRRRRITANGYAPYVRPRSSAAAYNRSIPAR
jgi:hypothetical protein